MNKRFLSLVLAIAIVVSCGVITVNAAGLDPYLGFNASMIDDHQAARTSFSTSGKLGGIWVGDWACYKKLDFGETPATSVEIGVGVPEGYSDAIELRIDAPNGPRIAYVPITPSGSFATPVPCRADLEKPVTGVHDLYITNAKSTSDIYTIKFFKPKEKSAQIPEFDDSDAYADIAEDANNRAINMLYKLGILREYEDGNLDPQLLVTRGEFAYSIFKLYGVPNDEKGTFTTPFSDVPGDKYYTQAVAYLYNMGIIKGNGEGLFKPDSFITHIDALTLLCRVMEYDAIAQQKGGYPGGYFRIATEQKFNLPDKDISEFIRRTEMAKMLYRAIDATVLITTGVKDDYAVYDKEEGLLYKTRGVRCGTGLVAGNSFTNLYLPESDLKQDEVVIDGNKYKVGNTDAISLLGFECEFYYEEQDGISTLVGIMPMSDVDTYTVTTEENRIYTINNSKISYYSLKDKQTDFVITKDTAVLYNGIAIDEKLEELVEDVSKFSGRIRFVENGNGKNTVMIEEYVNYVAGTINMVDGVIIDYNDSSKKIEVNPKKDKIYVSKQDETISFEEIEEGDVLSVFASKNKSGGKYIRIYINTDEISGQIMSFDNGNKKATIGGVEYRVSPYCSKTLKLGLKGKFKLDINGNITDYSEDSTVSEKIVGLYMNMAVSDVGFEKIVKLSIITSKGKAESFEIAQKVTVDGIRFTDSSKLQGGTDEWEGLGALTKEKPILYKLNSDNQITWIDTLLTGNGDNNDTLKQLTNGDNITHNWQRNIMSINMPVQGTTHAIGHFYIPSTAALISFFEDSDKSIENWTISTIGNKFGRTAYPKGEVYSTTGDTYSGDLFVWRNSQTSTSAGAPFVFTGMATAVDENGDLFYIVQGVSGNAKVEYTLTEDGYNSGILADALSGDVIRVKLNGDKEIFGSEYVAFRDGEASRNGKIPMISKDIRVSGSTNRDYRFIYGKVAEKAQDYLVIDLGKATTEPDSPTVYEVIARDGAEIASVYNNGINEHTVAAGYDAKSISEGDTIFAYLGYGGTSLIVVYEDKTL